MAASQRQIRHVTQKLENLDEERRALHGLLDRSVDKILAVGKSWVNNQGSSSYNFKDISLKIESALTFLFEKSDEIPAGLMVEEEDEIPCPTPQESIATSSSSAAGVSRTSTSKSSGSLSASSKPSVQPSDQLLAQIINRLDNLENDHVKIKDLDHRLGQIETERREVDREKVKEVEGRLDHMDNSLKDLTTFLDRMERMEERMKALPGLDEELKKLQNEIKADRKKVDDIRSEVTSLAGQLQLSNKQPVGFTAQIPDFAVVTITSNTPVPVKDFTKIVTNKGNNYNPSTGEFTAPVDGVYLSSLTHSQRGPTSIELHVLCKRDKAGPCGEREDVMVCRTYTESHYSSCTDVGVVYMSAGDKLYVRAIYDGDVGGPSSFSCCLIG